MKLMLDIDEQLINEAVIKTLTVEIDRDYTEATYRAGNWFCADGERKDT